MPLSSSHLFYRGTSRDLRDFTKSKATRYPNSLADMLIMTDRETPWTAREAIALRFLSQSLENHEKVAQRYPFSLTCSF